MEIRTVLDEELKAHKALLFQHGPHFSKFVTEDGSGKKSQIQPLRTPQELY